MRKKEREDDLRKIYETGGERQKDDIESEREKGREEDESESEIEKEKDGLTTMD